MVLKGAPPTQTDPAYHFVIGGREVAPGGKPLKVNSDGIALSPDQEWLFFKPLTDDKLYKIKTADLRNAKLTEADLVKAVVDLGHVSITDGMEFDKKGNLYFGDMEHNTIVKITPDLKKTVLVEDSRLLWPDSYAVSQGRLPLHQHLAGADRAAVQQRRRHAHAAVRPVPPQDRPLTPRRGAASPPRSDRFRVPPRPRWR